MDADKLTNILRQMNMDIDNALITDSVNLTVIKAFIREMRKQSIRQADISIAGIEPKLPDEFTDDYAAFRELLIRERQTMLAEVAKEGENIRRQGHEYVAAARIRAADYEQRSKAKTDELEEIRRRGILNMPVGRAPAPVEKRRADPYNREPRRPHKDKPDL